MNEARGALVSGIRFLDGAFCAHCRVSELLCGCASFVEDQAVEVIGLGRGVTLGIGLRWNAVEHMFCRLEDYH